ncbi:hypothetical protein [Flavobacterium sp.]|uniref:hypothetical protein n=1 Tax=Flavobacterium sp. TaxID=239 RepID=UPI002633F338|nr:hypothetical protein [Flavobacterium sp.]
MNITIKKASLRGSLFLSYDFEQQDADVKNLIKTSSDAPIHDDLRNAYRRLIPHFAFICEEVKDEELVRKAIENPDAYLYDREVASDDTFFKFRVAEFSIEEKKGFEYLHLFGCKSLATFQEVCFSSPKIHMEDTKYPFRNELAKNIEDLKAEVLAYMQGKQAPKTQLEMFEGEEEEETPAPTKKTKKAKAESAFQEAE